MADYSDRMLDTSTPLTVVADVLSDVATRLGGEYIHLAETSSSPEEEERFVEKAFDVRARKKNIDHDDREAMVAMIRELKTEFEELENR
ncbi:hypothetical protein [Nocardiopsis alkaliphila]|uniref:hypothetical protein n=1 Tax=Nocardiopsis alkaliphila TaxID=225762 RepID=UPI00037DEEA7|nr:hypothetical protein [Nocardiopsis alkaliphila]